MSLDANLAGVHPVLAHRVRLLLALPELKGYGTYPAVRSRAKQAALFARWKAGTGNLAADPDRVLRTTSRFREQFDWTPTGSWHMPQGPERYGYAVDLKRPWNRTRAQARAEVHPHLERMGLRATVRSEWWHIQHVTSSTGTLPGPMPDDENEGPADMQIINDTEKKRMFASWTLNGTTIVREYATYRGPDVGEALPGISIIIDEQIAKKQIVKA